MFKNSEVKRLFVILMIIFLVFLSSVFFTTKIIINNYKNYFLDYNAKVVNAVIEKYPDATTDVIDLIIKGNNDKKMLNRYGINDEKLLERVGSLKEQYNNVLIINLILVIAIFFSISIIILFFVNRLYKRIKKLNDYAIGILENKTKLDIAHNSEGDISILRNKLYDITRLLKENNILLEKEKASLKDALADISHQIRTPLTSLYLYNEILCNEKDEVKKKDFLNRMRKELERIEWLITSLLKLSKIDSGTISFKSEKIDLLYLLKNVYEDMKKLINEKKIKVNISGDKNIFISGDFNWLKEALINIVKNAIEHTSKKGIIDISYNDNLLYTKIIIKDNGEGIDKKDIRHIFERFYKAKNSSKNSIGIGLSLSKSIILKHHGDIKVKSKKDDYTSFEIKIYKK